MKNWHGTLVDVAGSGVLLRGASGAGKSDLALRLIDRGAVLVADDQVKLEPRSRRLLGYAPDALYGLIEVRGVGVMSLPAIKSVGIALVVDLVSAEKVDRMPEVAHIEIEGWSFPLLTLNAFEASTPVKIELAIRHPGQIGLGVEDYKKGRLWDKIKSDS